MPGRERMEGPAVAAGVVLQRLVGASGDETPEDPRAEVEGQQREERHRPPGAARVPKRLSPVRPILDPHHQPPSLLQQPLLVRRSLAGA